MPHGPARLQRALQLFEAALEQPAAHREAWLARECAGDAGLLEQVQAMLAADAATGSDPIRARLAALHNGDGEAASTDLPPGSRIGPWEVLGVIGHGGMGAVYRVARADGQYQRDAALKRIRIGLDNDAARQRFLRERQILAHLQHPNIAQLLDGGVDDAGAPYFVMARIEGQRITRYCDERRLDVRARVRLLLQVLDAVAFAHRQLVVHRDLKPSNILVDVDGHAWLLDFGIAKLIEDEPERTATGERAFTPEYASPEQLHGEPVSTATDLYQLGVLLYGLLAQAHPYGLTGHTPLVERLRRMDEDPQPLSQVARDLPADAAALRGGTPATLERDLRGDLDAIAAHCLARDPARRYGSVDALRGDLLAWLDGKPVNARAPTARYRIGRFVRRNKLAVGAAAAVTAALCAGLGLALWQAHAARLQAQRADVVNGYLVDVFRSIDPDEGLGPDATVRQLIDAGVARLDRGELRAQPGAEGKLRLTLADSYIALGEYPKAGAELAHALKLLPATQADDALQARVRQAEVRLLAEDLGGMERMLDASDTWLLAHASTVSEPDAAAAQLQMQRAKLLAHREQYGPAEKLARDAWERMRKLHGDADVQTRSLLIDYAEILSGNGKHAEAAARAQQVADGIRNALPVNQFRLATALHNLAAYQSHAGEGELAIASEQQALAIRRRILPPNHPYIAISIGHLATLLDDIGRNHDALPLHAEATAIFRRQPPGQENGLAHELNNWGVGCYGVGDMICASDKIGEAITVWARVLSADHANLLAARSNLAALYSRSGRLADGETQLRQVVAALEAKQRASHDTETVTSLSAARNELADNLLNQGHNAEALTISRQRWQDLQAGGDPGKYAATALSTLALAELANNLPRQALEHARLATEHAHTTLPDGDREAFALMTLARAQLASDNASAAVTQARKAITMFTSALGADHRNTGLARGVLARALLASGQRAEARKELDAAIAVLSAKAPWLPELAELRSMR